MPLTIYCQECGSPTNYTSQSPKFCSGCGVQFDAVASTPVKKTTPTAPIRKATPKPQVQANYEDYEEEVPYSNNLEELDIEVIGTKRKKTTIKDVMGQKNDDDGPIRPIKKLSKSAQKQQLKDLLAESAKTARISIGDDNESDD